MDIVQHLNFSLALGTLLLQATTVGLIILYFTKQRDVIAPLLKKWGLLVIFLSSTASVLLTLLYSEVFGFVPCGLCWLQRVFLYPIAVISGIALFKKDTAINDYIIVLSIPGAIVALYQHYLQMGGAALVNCPITAGADCAKRILFEFGYITFPLMSFTAFVFFIALMVYTRQNISSYKSH